MIITLKILILLWSINLTPVLLGYVFAKKWSWPLDKETLFIDGKRLFGNHKTVRGLICGVIAGSIIGLLLGFPLWVGFISGLLSMVGDIFGSFTKRRFSLSPGKVVPVFDQLLEGLFPLVLLGPVFSLSGIHVVFLLIVFIITTFLGSLFLNEVLLTRPFHSYSREILLKIRFREWRACQTISYPFHPVLNIERTIYYHLFMKTVFRLLGLYNVGMKNALDVNLKTLNFEFNKLPDSFHNYQVLFISDLHLDCLDGLTEKLRSIVKNLSVDLCILGGDYRTESYGSFSKALESMKELIGDINAKDGIYAVLGNHDCFEMVPPLREAGVIFLVNESETIEKKGSRIIIAGVDDPFYYEGSDLKETFNKVSNDAFKILVAHSPEVYRDAAEYGSDLYLCGHTHAGQVQIPGIGPVITHCNAPKEMVHGKWKYKHMTGYTSSGAGTSGVPVRFGCKGEVVLITLKKVT